MAVTNISQNRDTLAPWYRIALPAHGAVEILTDKIRFYTHARERGLPIPDTRVLHSRADAERAAKTMSFPCVLKPRNSKSPRWLGQTRLKAFKTLESEHLLTLYDRYAPYADGLVAQQWINGDDDSLFTCNGYFGASGEPLVTFVSRKLRQWPPSTGEGSLSVECRADDIVDQTVRVFQSFGYHGLAYLEFKRDAVSGETVIVEPNIGRPTGRSGLIEKSGVEMMYTMYCDLAGLPLPENREQQYGGTKWVWFRRDVLSSAHAWRNGNLSLRGWVASLRGRKARALWSWRDPAPYFADLLRAGRLLLSAKERGKRAVAAPGSGARSVDIELQGLVRLRLLDAPCETIDDIAQRFGQPLPVGPEVPDLTVRFTDARAPHNVRYIGLNEAAYDEDGFYVLDRLTGEVEARVPLGELGQPCTITCYRGVRRCPLLFDAIRLTMLRKGHVPLHAAAFEYQGAGVLVAGWAYGGKTESLFAFARNGARYLGDEWVILARDGQAMFGVPSPLTIQDWQFPHVGELLPRVGLARRAFFAGIGLVDATHRRLARGRLRSTFAMTLLARGLPRLRKQRAIKADPRTVFPDLELGRTTSPETVFLVHSHAGADTEVSPIEPTELAERMSHALAYERAELLGYYAAYRFAFPHARNELLESATEREASMLNEALAGKDTYLVTHPYPVDFEQLFAQMESRCRASLWQPSLSSA